MKKSYLTLLFLASSILSTYAQLSQYKVKLIDDGQRMVPDPGNNGNKRSLAAPTQCGTDTVEYPYHKTQTNLGSQLQVVTVTKGYALGQMYSCPKPLVLTGFSFYAFVINSNPPTYRSMKLICSVYKAGPDSLPRGLPLRSDTMIIDTTFGGGVISKFMKRATWAPITLDSNYIITVGTDTSSLNAGIVTNDFRRGDGRKENLNCGSITGLWYNGRNLRIGTAPFDADVLLHPYVTYKFGTDFSIKNCYNVNDTVVFTNASASNMTGSKMYNYYLFYGIGIYSHLWDIGNGFGNTYALDYKFKYGSKQNYSIRLISTVYHYRSETWGCTDTAIKMLYFKPDIPTFTGLTNLCIGDTAKFNALSNDTGVVFEWLAKPNSPTPFFKGDEYKKFPLTKNDTIYLRANNHGCISGVRTIILRVNAYPTSLVVKDDSICSGSKANLKASTSIGTVNWYTAPNGGLPFYSGSVYQTIVLNKDTVFYAQATNNGCILNPRMAVKAFVGANFAPAAPSISNDTTLCLSTGTGVTLTATATTGLTIRWFDVSTGGTSINTGSTFNFFPTKREVKTYYADAYNGVCGSTRVPVNITVEDYPSISAIKRDTICMGDSAYLGFTLPFGSANWYDASSAGNLVHTGTNLTSAPLSTKDYYIETNSGVCTSPTRTKITAIVNTFPVILKLWGDTICAKNKATLKSQLSGSGTLNWYDSDTGNVLLGTGKTFQTPVINGTRKYYAQPVYAGCTGPKLSVQPTVKSAPFSGFSFEVLTWQQVKVSPINAAGASIKWDFGDGTTSNNTTVTHRYQNTGTYQVKLILTSTTTGCKDSTIISVIIEASGINSISKLAQASVYPNPAGMVLNIHSDVLQNEKAVVSIFSSSGALVHQAETNVKDGLITIPVSSIAPGLYIIQINGIGPVMFIKE